MTEPNPTLLPPPRATRSRRVRFLWLLVIFTSGAVSGAAGGGYWMRERLLTVLKRPEQAPERIVPHLQSQLGLRPEQVERVGEIVRRRHAAMEALRAEMHPQQLVEFQAMCEEVAEVLEPQQRAKWSEIRTSVESRYLPTAPVGPPPSDLLFRRFDVNHDGALSADEVPPRMWWRLSQADTDGDGKVTLSEYQAAQR